MNDKLQYTQSGHIAELVLNMPDTRNALTDMDLCAALGAAMERISADESVRCAILTGAGKAFSSGGNVKHMRDRSGMFAGDAIDVASQYRRGIQRLAQSVWACDVPLIAAVNGPAYGAGCDLSCMCDMRIAASTARFAENFVSVGLISGDGGAWLLPRRIGLSRAAEMALTGDPIDAQTALDWGLVSRVVPPEALMDAARDLAARVARNPPRQLRLTKRLLREGQSQSLAGLLELSAAYQGAAHQTRDHLEAVSAFLDKRAPDFSGT